MISKAKAKLIHSLRLKKQRDKEHLFIAEGSKIVGDLMFKIKPKLIVATSQWIAKNTNNRFRKDDVIEVDDEGLKTLSLLQNPQDVIALFNTDDWLESFPPTTTPLSADKLVIVLDGIQDPGNMGTIIRIADWFGIDNIFCSRDTVDVFNPKVVQATMGSMARVKVEYVDLQILFRELPDNFPIYATALDGDNIYETNLTKGGMIVMGNEGNGISKETRQKIDKKLLIPAFEHSEVKPDSINVAVATAIVCSEFRRK